MSGAISAVAALRFAVVTGIIGFWLLYVARGRLLAPLLLAAGYGVYVGLYTLWFKRRSIHGAVVGGIAGAMPPVVGYCVVTGEVDATE